MVMPVKIEISDSNYRKLLDAKEEMGYESIDAVLEVVLDFWWTFSELTNKENGGQ